LFTAFQGLLISFWTYRKHTMNTDPFSLTIGDDPDMDEITQILARRQITKLFTLGKRNILDDSQDGRQDASSTETQP